MSDSTSGSTGYEGDYNTGFVDNVLAQLFLLPCVGLGSLKLVARRGQGEHRDARGGRSLTLGWLGGNEVDNLVQGEVRAVGDDGLDHLQLILAVGHFGFGTCVRGLGLGVLSSAGFGQASFALAARRQGGSGSCRTGWEGGRGGLKSDVGAAHVVFGSREIQNLGKACLLILQEEGQCMCWVWVRVQQGQVSGPQNVDHTLKVSQFLSEGGVASGIHNRGVRPGSLQSSQLGFQGLVPFL